MGAFAEWQPLYAEHGIATFPVKIDGKNKKPAISGYMKVGHRASCQLPLKFGDVDALGFVLGRRSRITVLDVDTPDERILADALGRHGKTPIIVQSGSGNYQCWYRHNGETRRIRPTKDLPIDVLGGGFVVAPPSVGSRAPYQFVQGGLDEVANLPVLRNAPAIAPTVAINIEQSFTESTSAVRTGDRNVTLFRCLMRSALRFELFDAFLDFARGANCEFRTPLDDLEVIKVAHSAWGYTMRGENHFSAPPKVLVNHRTVEALAGPSPDALALLMILKQHHASGSEFILSQAMARSLGWGERRWRNARGVLSERGFIRCLHAGGYGPKDPPIFAWPKGGQNDPQ
jgi:hypothetical protein